MLQINSLPFFVDIPCGGFLTSSGPETLTYPEFAIQYTENQHCVWYIDVGKGKEVKISQVSFNLEKSDGRFHNLFLLSILQFFLFVFSSLFLMIVFYVQSFQIIK